MNKSNFTGVPISPNEVQERKNEAIPNEIITAFNDLIVENWDGRTATLKQEAVIKKSIGYLNTSGRITGQARTVRKEIFDKNWLDVEPLFRAAGWNVEYDKPSYDETYEPFFVFSKEKK